MPRVKIAENFLPFLGKKSIKKKKLLTRTDRHVQTKTRAFARANFKFLSDINATTFAEITLISRIFSKRHWYIFEHPMHTL